MSNECLSALELNELLSSPVTDEQSEVLFRFELCREQLDHGMTFSFEELKKMAEGTLAEMLAEYRNTLLKEYYRCNSSGERIHRHGIVVPDLEFTQDWVSRWQMYNGLHLFHKTTPSEGGESNTAIIARLDKPKLTLQRRKGAPLLDSGGRDAILRTLCFYQPNAKEGLESCYDYAAMWAKKNNLFELLKPAIQFQKSLQLQSNDDVRFVCDAISDDEFYYKSNANLNIPYCAVLELAKLEHSDDAQVQLVEVHSGEHVEVKIFNCTYNLKNDFFIGCLLDRRRGSKELLQKLGAIYIEG